MAININSNFKVGSPEPLDTRNVLTKEEMLAINDATMPEVYYAVGADDGKFYLYNKDNTPSETTGKFRVFEGGDGAKIWEGTRAEYEAQKDTIEPGTLIVITDDEGSFGSVFYDCTQEEYDELPDDKLSNGIAYMISEEGSTTVKLVRNGKEISGNGDAVIEVDELPEEADNKVYICNVNTTFYPFETAANYDIETAEAVLRDALDTIGVTYQITKTSSSVLAELDYDNSKNEMKVYYPENTVAKNVTKIKYDVALSGDCVWKSNQNGETEYLFNTVSYIVLGWSGEGVDVTKTVFAKDVELATKEYVDNLPTGGDAVIEVDEYPAEIENKVYNVAKEKHIEKDINFNFPVGVYASGTELPDYSEDERALLTMLDELNISYTISGNQSSIVYTLSYDGDFLPTGYENYGNVSIIMFQCVYGSKPTWGWRISFAHQTWDYIKGISWDLHREYDTIDRDVFSKDIELATKEYVDNLPTTDIEINVEEEATETLDNIKVADVVYKVESGDAVLHVDTMPEQIKNKVYVNKKILTFKILPKSQFSSEEEYENYLKETFDEYKIQYENGSPEPDINLDKQYIIKSPLYWEAKTWAKQRIVRLRHFTNGTWQIFTENNMGFTVEQIYGFQNSKYYTDLRTFVYASEVELATKEALDRVEEEIDSINLKAAMAVDEKPTYNEADGTISYIQNGVAGTTDNTDQWFYYVEDDQMYQTIWIGGIEKTILSAGEEVDAMRVKLTKADDTKKSLQLMYEDGELGGGAISMTKAEWEVYDKDSLNDKAEIIITDDVEDGGDTPIAIMNFNDPIDKWLVDANNSLATAKEAEANGIAVGFIRQTGTNTTIIHEVDENGKNVTITGADIFAGGCYVNSVTFPVKKGRKYYVENKTGSIENYGTLKFYPFKSEVVQPLKAEDKYSTEETVVGEWIDGKPIYRRVIVYTGSVGVKTKIDSTLTYSYIDSIVRYNITGLDSSNSTNAIIPIPTASANSSSGTSSCDWWIQSDGFYVGVGNSRTTTKITAIFEYTKK